MNRLQKKCTIASAGVHLLLAGILVIGPGFLSRKSKLDDMATLDWIPAKLVDAAVSGGGNPTAKPPPMAVPAPQPPVPQPIAQPPPPQPQPQPQPERKAEPEPPKEQPKPPKIVEQADAPEPVRKRHLPNVPTTPVKAKPNTDKTAENQAKAAAAQQLADRRRLADMIRSTATGLKADASSATSVEMPGVGGGEAYANYTQVVRSVYEHAWIAPDDAANDDAITKVTITIARDGSVISGRILNPSGDASVDRSVQRTLDSVRFVAPFPEGAKDKQRTFTINFNLKAKRLLG